MEQKVYNRAIWVYETRGNESLLLPRSFLGTFAAKKSV